MKDDYFGTAFLGSHYVVIRLFLILNINFIFNLIMSFFTGGGFLWAEMILWRKLLGADLKKKNTNDSEAISARWCAETRRFLSPSVESNRTTTLWKRHTTDETEKQKCTRVYDDVRSWHVAPETISRPFVHVVITSTLLTDLTGRSYY